MGDIPAFRPKIGKGRGGARTGQGSFRNQLLAAIGRAGGAYRKATRPPRRSYSRIDVRPPRADSRRVLVKARYVKMTPSGAKAARLHLRYIERDGVEKDGSKGLLYGEEGPERARSFEEPRKGEKHQFRFIISPEDADELDLTAYVKSFMTRVERDMGRELEWGAVNHYDTEHPHAHVVVRGVDRAGHEVRFERDYISRGMRWRAEDLATLELGPRREWDIERTRAKEMAHDRFTALDRDLERRAIDNVVTVRRGGADLDREPARESHLLGRLRHLEDLGLAERIEPLTWRLADGWAPALKDMGMRGDIIKQMHLALHGDPARYQIVGPDRPLEPTLAEPGPVLYGRVAAKGLSDELAGTYFAVVESPSGGGYHVQLDRGAVERLRAGDMVSVESKREIGRDGVERHRVIVQREEFSLDQQVPYRGPVLLDRLRDRSLAFHGFGRDVRQALERREALLRSLGIEPDDADKAAKLHELERRDIGQEIAGRSGRAFLADTPPTFQGRVEAMPSGGNGTRYALIGDGSRLIVVEATPELAFRVGQDLGIERGSGGTLVARVLGIDRDR